MAVCSPGLTAFWLLQHICPPRTGSHEVILFVILRRRAQYVQRIKWVFLIAEAVADCKVCIPAFSAFGIVHVGAIYKNSHGLQNQISVFLPWHMGFQVKLLCCYFRKTSSVCWYPCSAQATCTPKCAAFRVGGVAGNLSGCAATSRGIIDWKRGGDSSFGVGKVSCGLS